MRELLVGFVADMVIFGVTGLAGWAALESFGCHVPLIGCMLTVTVLRGLRVAIAPLNR